MFSPMVSEGLSTVSIERYYFYLSLLRKPNRRGEKESAVARKHETPSPKPEPHLGREPPLRATQ